MKRLKILTLGALALASASVVHAQTTIRIVASNGDRVATQTAISNILEAGWVYRGINGNATSANLSVATGSNFGAWKGNYNTGTVQNPVLNSVVIKTSYAGALAGIAAVASSPKLDQRFVVTDGTGSGAGPGSHDGNAARDGLRAWQGGLRFLHELPEHLAVQRDLPRHHLHLTSPGDRRRVAARLLRKPRLPTTAANITTQLAQLLYTTGSLPLALFTGDFTNDGNKIVYAIGRNTDAGQRFGAYTEVGLGTTTQVSVWKPVYSTAQTTSGGITYGGIVGSHAFWPAETVSNVFSPWAMAVSRRARPLPPR